MSEIAFVRRQLSLTIDNFETSVWAVLGNVTIRRAESLITYTVKPVLAFTYTKQQKLPVITRQCFLSQYLNFNNVLTCMKQPLIFNNVLTCMKRPLIFKNALTCIKQPLNFNNVLTCMKKPLNLNNVLTCMKQPLNFNNVFTCIKRPPSCKGHLICPLTGLRHVWPQRIFFLSFSNKTIKSNKFAVTCQPAKD